MTTRKTSSKMMNPVNRFSTTGSLNMSTANRNDNFPMNLSSIAATDYPNELSAATSTTKKTSSEVNLSNHDSIGSLDMSTRSRYAIFRMNLPEQAATEHTEDLRTTATNDNSEMNQFATTCIGSLNQSTRNKNANFRMYIMPQHEATNCPQDLRTAKSYAGTERNQLNGVLPIRSLDLTTTNSNAYFQTNLSNHAITDYPEGSWMPKRNAMAETSLLNRVSTSESFDLGTRKRYANSQTNLPNGLSKQAATDYPDILGIAPRKIGSPLSPLNQVSISSLDPSTRNMNCQTNLSEQVATDHPEDLRNFRINMPQQAANLNCPQDLRTIKSYASTEMNRLDGVSPIRALDLSTADRNAHFQTNMSSHVATAYPEGLWTPKRNVNAETSLLNRVSTTDYFDLGTRNRYAVSQTNLPNGLPKLAATDYPDKLRITSRKTSSQINPLNQVSIRSLDLSTRFTNFQTSISERAATDLPENLRITIRNTSSESAINPLNQVSSIGALDLTTRTGNANFLTNLPKHVATNRPQDLRMTKRNARTETNLLNRVSTIRSLDLSTANRLNANVSNHAAIDYSEAGLRTLERTVSSETNRLNQDILAPYDLRITANCERNLSNNVQTDHTEDLMWSRKGNAISEMQSSNHLSIGALDLSTMNGTSQTNLSNQTRIEYHDLRTTKRSTDTETIDHSHDKISIDPRDLRITTRNLNFKANQFSQASFSLMTDPITNLGNQIPLKRPEKDARMTKPDTNEINSLDRRATEPNVNRETNILNQNPINHPNEYLRTTGINANTETNILNSALTDYPDEDLGSTKGNTNSKATTDPPKCDDKLLQNTDAREGSGKLAQLFDSFDESPRKTSSCKNQNHSKPVVSTVDNDVATRNKADGSNKITKENRREMLRRYFNIIANTDDQLLSQRNGLGQTNVSDSKEHYSESKLDCTTDPTASAMSAISLDAVAEHLIGQRTPLTCCECCCPDANTINHVGCNKPKLESAINDLLTRGFQNASGINDFNEMGPSTVLPSLLRLFEDRLDGLQQVLHLLNLTTKANTTRATEVFNASVKEDINAVKSMKASANSTLSSNEVRHESCNLCDLSEQQRPGKQNRQDQEMAKDSLRKPMPKYSNKRTRRFLPPLSKSGKEHKMRDKEFLLEVNNRIEKTDPCVSGNIKKMLKPFRCYICGLVSHSLEIQRWHMTKHTKRSKSSRIICNRKQKQVKNTSHEDNKSGTKSRSRARNIQKQTTTPSPNHKGQNRPTNVVDTFKQHSTGQRNPNQTEKSTKPSPHDQGHLCNFCGKHCATKKQYQAHIRINHRERPYPCEICGKRFIDRSHLKIHMRVHTKEKPYVCKYCGKSFTVSSNLKCHIRTHTLEKPFECEYCQRKFTQRSNLKCHIRIHTKEKPFQCNYCQKSFTLKCILTRHLRSHTKEKPYACNVCDKRYAYRYSLTVHRQQNIKCRSGSDSPVSVGSIEETDSQEGSP